MKKSAAFSINVNQVPPEGRQYVFPIDPFWIVEQLSDCEVHSPSEGGSVSLTISPLGEDYYIKGKVTVAFTMTCVRCLNEAAVSLSVPLSVVMVKEGSSSLLPRGKRTDSGVRRFAGEEIVLDEEIRESIVLELPMSPTCPQGCSVEDLYKD
jgi:uncharacterized metal-binding protein YceD (DUF177 family)